MSRGRQSVQAIKEGETNLFMTITTKVTKLPPPPLPHLCLSKLHQRPATVAAEPPVDPNNLFVAPWSILIFQELATLWAKQLNLLPYYWVSCLFPLLNSHVYN